MRPLLRNYLVELTYSVIACLLVLFLLIHPADNRQLYNEEGIRQVMSDDGWRSSLPDSIRRVEDSVKHSKDWKVSQLRGNGESSTSINIGVRRIYECDSCNSRDFNKYADTYRNKYYLFLPGYSLNEDYYFLIENGKYYLQKQDTVSLFKNGVKVGGNQPKEIPVRFAADEDPNESGVLLPISEGAYNTWLIVHKILFYFFIIYALITFVYLPVKILQDIAAGKPFTYRNVRRLQWIVYLVFGIVLLSLLTTIIYKLIFGSRIPEGIEFSFWLTLHHYKAVLVVAVVVVLISYAFKKGYKLQQEQDLTV